MTAGELVNDALWTAVIDAIKRRLPYAGTVETWDGVALADVGLDSMAAIDLVLDIEQAFGVMFPDELLVAETFTTATSLYEVVLKLQNNGVQ